MTVSTTQSQSVLLGNDSTSSFNFSFNNGVPFNSNTSLASYTVIYTDSDGNQTVLAPSTYSLSFTAALTGSLWGIGGTLVYPISGSPIASGTSLTLQRIFPLQQLTSISNQGDFAPQNIEAMGDIEEMQLQQVAARTGLLRGTWASGVQYDYSDVVIDGANGANTGNYYLCAIPNMSGTWSTDLANGDWSLAINVQIIEGYAVTASSGAATATAEAIIATTQAGIATAAASTATTQAGIATTAATQASNYAAAYSATSTTSQAIATGAKTFSTQSGKLFVGGQYLLISSNANSANYMHGTVSSYAGTTLAMNITDIGGTGTHADWNISISGTQGPVGPAGGVAVMGSPVSGNLAQFAGATSITNGNLSGDISTSGGLVATLATVNANVGTFAVSTVNAKGLVTAATNLSGDIATSGAVGTLATVNSNVGTFTNASVTVNAKGLVTAASSGPNGTSYALFQEEQPQGTNGGTFTAGAWLTRALNTATINNISGSSLSSNQIILPAGTYQIQTYAVANGVNGHITRLQNITDSTQILLGSASYSNTGVTGATPSFVNGLFTLASTKTVALQHYCAVTEASTGFGVDAATGSGVNNIYSSVTLIKVS